MLSELKADQIESLSYDQAGLIPAVIQDEVTKSVLMVAYMSQESLSTTFETGETVFYSRSRKSIWHKGATSGNVQRVKSISTDCDRDTLLVIVNPTGPSCHRGTVTCFDLDSGGQE